MMEYQSLQTFPTFLFENLIALNWLGLLVLNNNQVAMLVRSDVRYSGQSRASAVILG